MSFPRKRESINLKERETTTRLYVGADICVRPKRTREQESEIRARARIEQESEK